MRRNLMIAAAALALAGPVRAVLPQEQLADARQEARARRLGSELRCLVCQNQTIDDSEAPLAADLRVLLRQRLRAGDTDRQAIDYIVERYGHYVLLQPPFELQTALLWLGPALVFAAGAAGVVLFVRRGRGPTPAEAPLTAEELALLARRLEQEEA